ncbi:hypothetical protein MBLNU457_g2779t1 [Dothideomycetes sp. NU457]
MADAINDAGTRREIESSREDREFAAEFTYNLPPLTLREDALLQVGPYYHNVGVNPATHPRDRPIHTDFDSRAPVHFCKKKLYGATVEVELPSSFYDLSYVLKAPDNSVVYADFLSPITVHIDLLEPLEPGNYDVASDLMALQAHQDAIIAEYDSEDPTKRRKDLEGTIVGSRFETGPTKFAQLGHVTPRMRQFGQYQMEFFQRFDNLEDHDQVPLKGIKRDRPDWVAVYVGLIRYQGQPGQEHRNTDIVITVSVPHIPGLVRNFTKEHDEDRPHETIQEKREIPLVQKGRFVLERMLQTFDIVNEELLAT